MGKNMSLIPIQHPLDDRTLNTNTMTLNMNVTSTSNTCSMSNTIRQSYLRVLFVLLGLVMVVCTKCETIVTALTPETAATTTNHNDQSSLRKTMLLSSPILRGNNSKMVTLQTKPNESIMTTKTSSTLAKSSHAESSSSLELRQSNNATTTKTTTTIPTTFLSLPIKDYLEVMKQNGMKGVVLLQWNPDGTLRRSSELISHKRWFATTALQDPVVMSTRPSPYGKVALLYNNDVIHRVEWNYQYKPPIPFIVYTLPDIIEYHDITKSNDLTANNEMDNDSRLSVDRQYVLIPDPYDRIGQNEGVVEGIRNYMTRNHYDFIVTYDNYIQRHSIMVWRGSIHPKTDLSRVALIQLAKDDSNSTSWLDVADSFFLATDSAYKHIDAPVMISDYKYQIDIGGVSGTSWGGLRWKMCSGGLVFKVDTWSQDWWHTMLQPYVHYIPVHADLSNLRQQYEWAEAHPQDAYQIAYNGQQVCLQTYTEAYSRQKVHDILQQLPDATQDEIDDVNDIFENHLEHYFLEIELEQEGLLEDEHD